MRKKISFFTLLAICLTVFSAESSGGGSADKSIFWFTGEEHMEPHHSEGCGFYNIPALMVQEGYSAGPLTAVKPWFGEASGCSSFYKYQIERKYSMIKIGKRLPCPVDICQPGTDQVLNHLRILSPEGAPVKKVLFFDQGIVGLVYSLGCVRNDCDEAFDRLSLHRIDTQNPKNYLVQMKQKLSLQVD